MSAPSVPAETAESGPEGLVARLEAAYDVVCSISRGEQRWRMSVPVQRDDPDHLIGTALRQAIDALRDTLDQPITFQAFSGMNRARCESPHGFNHKVESWSLSDWFTAILGELGEAANLAKKLNRVRDGIPGNKESETELREKLQGELVDTFIYLDLTAQAAGFKLGDALLDVFDAKSRQIGYPEAQSLAGGRRQIVPDSSSSGVAARSRSTLNSEQLHPCGRGFCPALYGHPCDCQGQEMVTRGVEAAWRAMWAPHEPSSPAPTQDENHILWAQVRAIVAAVGQ